MVVQKVKAADRQGIITKLIPPLKKKYGSSQPKDDLGVLEALLFSICLENNSQERAVEVYESLHQSFHDLNEIRVSSISEIQAVFEGIEQPEWRAVRVRELLHYIFEKQYTFDMDFMLKKTLEQSEKILQQVSSLSPFVKHYGLMYSFGAHLFPLDDSLHNALQWLGLVEMGSNLADAEGQIKAAVRKSETAQIFHLLHELSTDTHYVDIFAQVRDEGAEEADLFSAHKRLAELFSDPASFRRKKPKAAAAKKAVEEEKPAAKSAAKKPAATAAPVDKKVAAPKKPATPPAAAAKKPVKKAKK